MPSSGIDVRRRVGPNNEGRVLAGIVILGLRNEFYGAEVLADFVVLCGVPGMDA